MPKIDISDETFKQLSEAIWEATSLAKSELITLPYDLNFDFFIRSGIPLTLAMWYDQSLRSRYNSIIWERHLPENPVLLDKEARSMLIEGEQVQTRSAVQRLNRLLDEEIFKAIYNLELEIRAILNRRIDQIKTG